MQAAIATSLKQAAYGTPRCCAAWAVACMLLATVGAVAATVIYQNVFIDLTNQMRSQYVIDSPASGSYATWADSNAKGAPDVFADFYVYSILNPSAVVHNNSKPQVEEIGPLRYAYKQAKFNVTWPVEEDGDVVSFVPWQYYVPYDAATIALQERNITTINMPLLAIMNNPLGPFGLYLQGGFNFDPMSLFVERPAKEVVFGWKNDSLLAYFRNVADIPVDYPGLQRNETDAQTAIATHPISSIYTGKLTSNLAREYQTWNGQQQALCCLYAPCGDVGAGKDAVYPWHSDSAEQILGTFGDQFHQFVSTSDTLRVSTHGFAAPRWWPMVYDSSYLVKGVSVYQFKEAPGTLGNDTVNPREAYDYDIHGPSGLLNITQCESGAQLYIGRPRFLGGSNSLREAVEGMGAPDPALHETYLGVEPTTGQTLDFGFRLSINVYVEPKLEDLGIFGKVWFFENLTKVYFPVLWMDRHATATDDEIATFKSRVSVALAAMTWLRWGGSASALAFGVLGTVCAVLAWRRHRDKEHAKELESAAYYAEFYRPLLSLEALAMMGVPITEDEQEGLQYVPPGGALRAARDPGLIQHGAGA